MTQNEKAKQLIKKHLTAISEESMDSNKMMFYSAKMCAIVTNLLPVPTIVVRCLSN